MTDEPKRLGRPPRPKTFAIRIDRGYFPFDGSGKIQPGTIREFGEAEARYITDKGIGVRMGSVWDD